MMVVHVISRHDYHRLNLITDPYHMPNISDMAKCMEEAFMFTTVETY